jgi:hypothetical protein
LLLTGLLWTGSAWGQVGLGLSPMRLEFSSSPGTVHTGVLTLRNEADSPVRVRSETLDFHLDNTATPQFEPALEHEADYSCRQWISINPMETEIGARQSVPVRYTVRVPGNAAARSYHCAAGFNSLPTATQSRESGIRAAVRMVAAFYFVVGQPAIEGEVSDVKLEAAPGGADQNWQAIVTIRNWGHRYFRPTGVIELVDSTGGVVTKADFPALPVLPNRSQRFLLPMNGKTEAGNYQLRARVAIGTPEVQEAVIPVVVSAPR